MKNKILNKKKLKQILSKQHNLGKKIVHCHGVFDVLHLGHFEHFSKAKSVGNILIVTVTADKFVNKGPNQPFFSTLQRMRALSHIESIDYVVESNYPDAIEMIKLIKPHFYCKGKDYINSKKDLTGKISQELSFVKKFNGKIIFTNEISFSSSKILNDNNLLLSDDQTKFVKDIKKKYDFNFIKNSIFNFKNTKILIIGELIIDKYVFCDAVGKSGKDPMLVFKHVKTEEYLGGAGAVANHLSDFCNNITLLTLLGEKNERKKFINQNLNKKIKTKFFSKEQSPTIVKTRFVDSNSKHKMLGVYDVNNEPLSNSTSSKIENYLKKDITNFDIVLTYDYGHGFLNNKLSNIISSKSKILALNAQVNSSSVGSHSIEKYKKSNFLIINESELRHELRDNISSVEQLLKKLEKRVSFKQCVVTRGMQGATMYSKELNKFFYCPAFASNVVDKIGAGDSFLPFYSISSILKNDFKLSLFIGSMAAAQSVESIGNSYNINKNKMLKSISHIIK